MNPSTHRGAGEEVETEAEDLALGPQVSIRDRSAFVRRACWVAWIAGPAIWLVCLAAMVLLRVGDLDQQPGDAAEGGVTALTSLLTLSACLPLAAHSVCAVVTIGLLVTPGAHRRSAAFVLLNVYCLLQLVLFLLVSSGAHSEPALFNTALAAAVVALCLPVVMVRGRPRR